jgi:Xaa-Pro dipeptidase
MVNRGRFDGLVELLNENNLDGVFIAPSSDLKYVTGLGLRQCSRLKGAVIAKDGRSFFLCPSLYLDDVASVREDIPVIEWKDEDGYQGAFREGLKLTGLDRRVRMAFTRGVEAGDMIDATSGLDIECVNGLFLLSPMRSVKSPEELALMRKASAMNDRMMEALAKYLRPGLTERDIRAFVMNFHESHGGRPRVPGVATGANSALPHYGGDNDRTLEERDIVMVDCGGWYDDYSHDMTRMFFIGEPTEEQRRVYDIVLRAQTAAEEAACVGAIPAELDKIARDIIGAEGYGEAFNHRLGHGIGMDGHEAPFISQANRKPLVEGNCFSIEPGIYLRGKFGVRIENLLMLTASGTEVINLYPKELMVLRNG